jgi:hypothetical protein
VTDDGVQRAESVGADDEFLQVFWQEFWNDDGCAGPLLTGNYETVLRRSDYWTERDYANTPLGSFFVNDLGVRHQVIVPMTPRTEPTGDSCCSATMVRTSPSVS